MLTKEKVDKQLAGQISSTPFMSVRDSKNKRVLFNTSDDLEQKIDRLAVMMGKLVTEGHPKPFKPEVYQSNRGRNQSRGNFHVGIEITHIGDAHHTIKILEEETEVTLAIEEITDITHKVVRDIGTITMIIGEKIIEVKAMIEIGEGHYIDRTEVE